MINYNILNLIFDKTAFKEWEEKMIIINNQYKSEYECNILQIYDKEHFILTRPYKCKKCSTKCANYFNSCPLPITVYDRISGIKSIFNKMCIKCDDKKKIRHSKNY